MGSLMVIRLLFPPRAMQWIGPFLAAAVAALMRRCHIARPEHLAVRSWGSRLRWASNLPCSAWPVRKWRHAHRAMA
jgi:hypothetical protein